MEEIQQLVAALRFDAVAAACEAHELNELARGVLLQEDFYAIALAALLIQNDLENAKYLWKRIPPGIKQRPDSKVAPIWNVGKLLWQKQYTLVHQAVQDLWTVGVNEVLASSIQAAVRGRAFDLVSRAYSTISVTDCAALLGLSESETLSQASAAKWQLQDQYFVIPPPVQVHSMELPSTQQLEQLTRYISHLEK